LNKIKLVISLIALITVSAELFCEESIIPIITTFGGRKNDYAYYVGQTEDGGYIIAGGTESFADDFADVYLIKTDASGNELWHKTFGGIESSGHGIYAVEKSGRGYFILGINVPYETVKQDIHIISTDDSGTETHTDIIEGTLSEYNIIIEAISDNGFIIMKDISSEGSWHFKLTKTDNTGNIIWDNSYKGSSNDYGSVVKPTDDGGYIITGYTNSYSSALQDIYLVKIDSAGIESWSNAFSIDDRDSGNSVEQTEDGGYIVLGTTSSLGSADSNMCLIKTDESGNEQWVQTYGGDNLEFGLKVLQTKDGGYIIAGWTYSFGTGDTADIYLVKTDDSGSELWHKVYGGPDDDYCFSIQQTEDSGYILTGFTESFGAGNTDVFLIKTDFKGNIEF